MLDERVRAEVVSRFPEGSLLQVELRARHLPPHDEEPGLALELVPRGPEEHNAKALEVAPPQRRGIPEEVYSQVVAEFRKAHESALQELTRDLPRLVPEATHLGVRYGGLLEAWNVPPPPEQPRNLTAVLARLDRTDLETLDTLIVAGFATSRAEAIRWALARIRERPVYKELQQRVSELEALKAQF